MQFGSYLVVCCSYSQFTKTPCKTKTTLFTVTVPKSSTVLEINQTGLLIGTFCKETIDSNEYFFQIRSVNHEIEELTNKRNVSNDPMEDKLTLFRQQVRKKSSWSKFCCCCLWNALAYLYSDHTLGCDHRAEEGVDGRDAQRLEERPLHHWRGTTGCLRDQLGAIHWHF
jgi:hypothetical protein